jgi:HSP20 family molecular chaperone IbpA
MNNGSEIVTQDKSEVRRREDEQAQRRITLTPPVDIFEDSQRVTLWADLPGVTKDRLNIKVSDGNLSFEAESVIPTPGGLRLQHAEIPQPFFARAFTLGADLDASKVDATLKDGVLKLTIPRREEARPRRIEVNAA